MIFHSIVISLFVSLLFVSKSFSGNAEIIIAQISDDLRQIKDVKAKSTLHIYRARQYSKSQKWELALEDYNDALELNHKGWIHLERSQFLLKTGKYELAYEDANAAKEEVPTLSREADKVIEGAVAAIRKKYESENPITIVMDTKVDRYRKTRFDLMREQGVGMYAKNTQGSSRSSNKRRSNTKKSSKTDCAPRAKS